MVHLRGWFGQRHWAAWVVSGVGLALAGLSLWYLIVVKALFLGSAVGDGPFSILLQAIEVVLLAAFSLVLVYGGYWLASSPFEADRLWWAGLWTMVGLAGIVAIVALVTAFRVLQGGEISEPTLIQEMLLAAGGGGLAGLLVGISTVKETVEGERAKRQRDTLLFVNELLRHNVLNGMQIIKGNADILHEHVDEDGERYLETTETRAESVVELIKNVRALMKSVSGEVPRRAVPLGSVLRGEVNHAEGSYPEATFERGDIPDVEVYADELLHAVFENLLANAVEHNDADEPKVTVAVESTQEHVTVRIADNGPGIPEADHDRVLQPGEQGDGSIGQGIGLYLVDTLVTRYNGDVRFRRNEPRGTVVEVELLRPEHAPGR